MGDTTDERTPVTDVAAPARGALAAVGRFCARHRWWIVAAWVLVVLGTTALDHRFGGTYEDDFTLPSAPAQTGLDLLQGHDPSAGGQTGQIVYTITSGSLAEHRDAIERATDAVDDVDHVLSSTDPLQQVSHDGRTAYSTVHFGANPASYGSGYVDSIEDAVSSASDDGVTVSFGGQLGAADRSAAGDLRSEAVGVGVAIVVLLIGFGSVYAAALPILTAIVGGLGAIGALGLVAASTTFPAVSPTLAIMIGLGVGIDYALFLTTRHRQLVMDGVDPVEAAARSVAKSGAAVVTAALTVVVALLGLYASGMTFIGKLGVAGGFGVVVGALTALTLVPAMLAIAGRSIDRVRVRRTVAEPVDDHSVWVRYAHTVARHPWRFLVAGLVLTAVLAVPMATMRLGHVDAGADPESYSDRQAYDAIADGFGVGANGPLTIVVHLPDAITQADTTGLAESVRSDLADVDGVDTVSALRPTSDGEVLVGTVIPTTGPQDDATVALVRTIQDTTLRHALDGSGADGYVTGTVAAQSQFRDQVAQRLPLIIAVVIAAAFFLLVLAFRAPVLALKAGIMNLLSVGAAYGVIVAVFQWGWGGSLLGVSETIPIESYIPMMMFAIVFGLSMDYEVFLLSRVHEHWVRSGDNTAAVGAGLAATARVISCAALIMASVFLAFAFSTNVTVKVLALGLGVSVLIDAFVIRLLLVPSTMFLLGKWNWWTPRWLDRALGRFALPGE